MKTIFGASMVVAFVSALLFGVGPQAQDNEGEVEEATSSEVSEPEINLFIEIYSAMHVDHSLTIDQALASRDTSLEQFRDIERRIQQEQRLVDRVRQALLDKAKARGTSLSALPVPPASSEPTPAK